MAADFRDEMNKIVRVVHCVDTEGPICEPIEATFERLKLMFKINIEPTLENLRKLQNKEIVLHGIEDELANCISNKRLAFLEDWGKLDEVLKELFSKDFRSSFQDTFGNSYMFSWYCLDHVGFETNPRRRALGYHVVLEHYLRWIRETNNKQDKIYWHYHGVPFNKAAHCFGRNWNFSNEHIQVVSRRIIDHGIFPCSFRPGGHMERLDMNMWLEQWIPFDYANQAMDNLDIDCQPDFSNGRTADWRRAPAEWGAYHPSHSDYQSKGNMNRYMFKCLNLDSRLGAIDQDEVDNAFEMADIGKKPVLAVTNHDNRDMRAEIKTFYEMLISAQKQFKDVKFKYMNAVDAARESLDLKKLQRLEFKLIWNGFTLHIESNHELFGGQPFLAIKTKEGNYYHDNLDHQGDTKWSYTFDWMTIKKDAIECIGIASNDCYGNTAVSRFYFADQSIDSQYQNLIDG